MIEILLASPLIDVLSPITVYKMDPALIRCVAGESEDRQALRAKLTKQLEILKRVAEICKCFDTDAHTSELTSIHPSKKKDLSLPHPLSLSPECVDRVPQ